MRNLIRHQRDQISGGGWGLRGRGGFLLNCPSRVLAKTGFHKCNNGLRRRFTGLTKVGQAKTLSFAAELEQLYAYLQSTYKSGCNMLASDL